MTSRHVTWIFIALLALAWGFLPPFTVTLLNYIGLCSMVAVGLVLLTGVGGMTSFGQAAFVGVGAYSTAWICTSPEVTQWLGGFIGGPLLPWVGLLFGLVIAFVVAWILGAITAKLWARCWDMPYCHESVRDECPAYKARKTCWRFGYGCMCHPRMIEAMIRASTQGATAVAKARQADYVRSDLSADAALKPDERTIPCTKCAVFTEHQRQKFRIINPLVIVGIVVGLIIGYKPVMVLYAAFVALLSRLAARFTLSDQVNPAEWFRYLDSPTVRIFFYVIVGTLLLAYVLKAVEYLILTKKWI